MYIMSIGEKDTRKRHQKKTQGYFQERFEAKKWNSAKVDFVPFVNIKTTSMLKPANTAAPA